jgi:hypothetical protein
MEEKAPEGTKLFIGGLSYETTDVQFASFFSRYGEVRDAKIMRVRGTGDSRGFGFVTFADANSAQKVLDSAAAGELELDGRKIDPKIAVPRDMNRQRPGPGGAPARTSKIFVGGLSPDTNQDSLREYFTVYGTISETMVMMDNATGRSRGFGFVTFESEESVDSVMNITNHSINNKAVECKRAIPKTNMGGGGRMGGWGGPPHGGFGGGYGGFGGYGAGYGAGGGGYGQQPNTGYGAVGGGYGAVGGGAAGGGYQDRSNGGGYGVVGGGTDVGGGYGYGNGMQQQFDQSNGYGAAYSGRSTGARNYRSYHPYSR